MQKIPKNSKILKNDGHFRIPHPQISLKQFSNIGENVVVFFLCRGVEKLFRIFAKQKNYKKLENGQFSFFLHFATTTHCNFKFWKIDPPYCTLRVRNSLCHAFAQLLFCSKLLILKSDHKQFAHITLYKRETVSN